MKTMSKLIGLYWYCQDFDSGQWSWQYRVLSNSKYSPSSLASSIDEESDEDAIAYYDRLVENFEHEEDRIFRREAKLKRERKNGRDS